MIGGAAQMPPAGAFAWRPNSVLVKATEARLDGWQLAGMVQYDAWGQAAFLHRYCRALLVHCCIALGYFSTGHTRYCCGAEASDSVKHHHMPADAPMCCLHAGR